MKFNLTCPKDWEAFSEYLANCDESKSYTVEIKATGNRTLSQNASIHLYCTLMANALNDAGYSFTDFSQLIRQRGVSVDWTRDLFKDEVWKRVQKAKVKKESTRKLTKLEVSDIYEEVNRKIAELAGVSMAFPDRRG